LIDAPHAVSSVFQFINVPTGIWIDERGRVVRPAEPAWTTTQSMKFGGKSLATEGQLYVAALRDWVKNGEHSAYALSDEEFTRRVKPRSSSEMEAEASFKLAVWFRENGNNESAARYFVRAQQLNPDDWNYYRQEWSFKPQEADQKWLEKFKKTEHQYYPHLELQPVEQKPESQRQ
jgi:hypothetical protein